MVNGGQFQDYDYDPPDPETRNVFNGFKYYISRHNAQIPPSFIRRLEEAPLPYHCQHRTITEDNDNAQYTAVFQAPPLRNDFRSHTLSTAAGPSGRSPVHTNIEKERDSMEDREMEKGRDRDRKEDREMEKDKDIDRKEDRKMDKDKDRDRKEDREMEKDKDRDRYRGRDKDRDRDKDRHRYRGRDRDRDRDRRKYRERDEHGDRDGRRAGRRVSSSDSERRRERNRSRSRSRRREWHSKTDRLKHEHEVEGSNRGYYPQLTSSSPRPRIYSAGRGGEERRRNETDSPPPRRQRERGREEAEDSAEDTNYDMSADDILEIYNPENNQEFNEMFTHPQEPLPHQIRELLQLDGPKNLASPSREAIDAASARQVELLANYNNCLQIEHEIRNNLKQSTDFLISTMKNTKMLKDRRFSCTQQHQKLQNDYSMLLKKMSPVNESWIDITGKELGLITAISDKLKLMETAEGFNEIDKLNAESNELQRQLEQIKEKGLEMKKQLEEFRDAEKNIANKLIEIITLSNSTDSSLKSEEEILKLRMEQHKNVMGDLQAARLKSETAKKEFDCARQELYSVCPDLANKFD